VSAGGEIRFSKEHEWLVVKEGIATMGISDFAQKQLGDIDSVKASSDIYCAASGEVVQVNEQILEHPELINQSPYESGWIAKLKLSNLQEFEKLMTREQYDEFVGGGEMNKDKDKDKKGDMPTNEGQNCTEGQEDHENQRNNNNNNNNQSSRQTEHRLDR
jgi:glycine cleavage system H protein